MELLAITELSQRTSYHNNVARISISRRQIGNARYQNALERDDVGARRRIKKFSNDVNHFTRNRYALVKAYFTIYPCQRVRLTSR